MSALASRHRALALGSPRRSSGRPRWAGREVGGLDDLNWDCGTCPEPRPGSAAPVADASEASTPSSATSNSASLYIARWLTASSEPKRVRPEPGHRVRAGAPARLPGGRAHGPGSARAWAAAQARWAAACPGCVRDRAGPGPRLGGGRVALARPSTAAARTGPGAHARAMASLPGACRGPGRVGHARGGPRPARTRQARARPPGLADRPLRNTAGRTACPGRLAPAGGPAHDRMVRIRARGPGTRSLAVPGDATGGRSSDRSIGCRSRAGPSRGRGDGPDRGVPIWCGAGPGWSSGRRAVRARDWPFGRLERAVQPAQTPEISTPTVTEPRLQPGSGPDRVSALDLGFFSADSDP